MNFFDRQEILEALLKTSNKAGNRNEKTKKNVENNNDNDYKNDSDENIIFDFSVNEFAVDIITLKNYFFIITSIDSITFEMHELVQLIIKKLLEAHDQLEK